MLCTMLCVPLWCRGSISCGTWILCTFPLLPAFSVMICFLSSLRAQSLMAEEWKSPLPPHTRHPREFNILVFFFDKLVQRERPFIFLKAYLSLWDGQAHPGSSCPCGLGCSHLGSCRQPCAAGGVSGAGTSGTSAGVAGIGWGLARPLNRLVGFFKWCLEGSKSSQPEF